MGAELYLQQVLRKIIPIILVASLSFSFWLNMSVMLWYGMNKTMIVKELCVQRNAKENSCQGCCQINKFSVNQNQQQESTEIKVNFELFSFVLLDEKENHLRDFDRVSKLHNYTDPRTHSGYTKSFFNPPDLV